MRWVLPPQSIEFHERALAPVSGSNLSNPVKSAVFPMFYLDPIGPLGKRSERRTSREDLEQDCPRRPSLNPSAPPYLRAHAIAVTRFRRQIGSPGVVACP